MIQMYRVRTGRKLGSPLVPLRHASALPLFANPVSLVRMMAAATMPVHRRANLPFVPSSCFARLLRCKAEPSMTRQRSEDHFPLSTSVEPIQVPVDGDGRVDVLVSHAIAGWSRRRVHALFEHGAVRINGQRARKGDRVRAGDVVAVDQSFLPSELAASPQLPVGLLHVDASLVAVDKPAGMPSLARRITDTGTVANPGRTFPELRDASPNPLEAGLLHRLDTVTSGVLVAARTRAA
jgi:hypothetical protein